MTTPPSRAEAWLYRPRPTPSPRLTLFLFPYAGATAQAYRELCLGLPADIDCRALQLPGRADRRAEPLFTRMEPLVEALEQILPLEPPFAFFGHSLGALTAYALALRLRSRGKPGPEKLLLSGRRAPHLLPEDHIHDLSERDFIRAITLRYNGIPEVLLREPELLAMFLPPLRADLTIYETWAPPEAEPLDVPFALFGGLSDPNGTREGLEAWRSYTRGAFSVHVLPGEHFFLNTARAQLLPLLRDELAGIR
jgi:medium-chain acyl-[acyl-carrier-protein] hydrolase